MAVRELIEKFEQKYDYEIMIFDNILGGLVGEYWSGNDDDVKAMEEYLDREVISWDIWLEGGFCLEVTIGE